MGQTLTHGIYLPDEGERNCYDGLAGNWQLLDGAVGTVAEHTAALAGKAPLVHTHTKSDITDFPALANVATSGSYNDLNNIPASFTPSSHTHGNITNDGKVGTTANLPLITGTDGVVQAGSFGNAANTFCEGNDSRLSDARTPVAHTHTKSDVTDLLNSNFIPSANNSYDLGSSSYQWNNLYAKNYYYNGVAWGLDKVNTWSAEQIVLNNFYTVKENNYELGQSYPNGNHLSGLYIKDKNGATVGLLDIVDRSYGNMEMRIRVQQKFDPNSNNRSTSGTVLFNEVVVGIASDKTNFVSFNADLWGANKNLGTSTSKWKSLNGVNPGALSFPRIVSADSRELDRTNWDYTGTNWNTLNTSAMTGWGYIYIEDCGATDFILIRRGTTKAERPTQSANPILDNNGKYCLYITFPIVQNTNVYALIRTSGTVKTSVVYPCQGTILS